MSNPYHVEVPVVRPATMFTLGSALRWLGHDCDCPHELCWEPVDTLAASVWFLHRGGHIVTFPLKSLVLVDLAETGAHLARLRRLLNDVDACTRENGIQIRPWTLRQDRRPHGESPPAAATRSAGRRS